MEARTASLRNSRQLNEFTGCVTAERALRASDVARHRVAGEHIPAGQTDRALARSGRTPRRRFVSRRSARRSRGPDQKTLRRDFTSACRTEARSSSSQRARPRHWGPAITLIKQARSPRRRSCNKPCRAPGRWTRWRRFADAGRNLGFQCTPSAREGCPRAQCGLCT